MGFFLRCLLSIILLFPSWGRAQGQAPFTIGVAPHTSARVIVESYQPLRRYLEKMLKQPVEVVTAPDFTEFTRRTQAGEYDLVVTTGHLAWLAREEAGYVPLLTYKAEFKALVVVAKSGPVKTPEDLRGRVVLGLSPSSGVTLWGGHWLRQQALDTAPIRYISASDSVGYAVAEGEAAAGFVSLANLQKMPEAVRQHLRILVESPPLAGRTYLLAARQAGRAVPVLGALLDFAETPEGQRYMAESKLGGYRPLRAGELDGMAPYGRIVREQLKTAAK